MIIGFGNNIVSSLAADITANQTTIRVMPGTGARFAGLLTYDYANSSNILKAYAKITLTDAKETVFEVCHLISVSNDILTVVRGQEDTTAKGWSTNDVVANFATRGSENQFVQIEQLQSGHYTAAVAGGTANALTLELPATYFLNGSTDWVLRSPVIVYPTQNNTGASTLQLTMGGRVLGTFPLYKGNKAALVANDILKDVALVCLMDNTRTFFNVANPGAIYAGLGTAAFRDAQTSVTDATAGRLMQNGAWGLGTYGIKITDANTADKNGFYSLEANNSINTPIATASWEMLCIKYDGGSAKQLFWQAGASSTKTYVRYRSSPGGVWGPFQSYYSTENKPTPSDIGAYPVGGGYINGNATAIGNLSAQNGAILINDVNGVRLFELSAKLDGSVTFTSLLTGKGFSIDNNGHLTTYIGSQLLESGQRVYSPNNPPPSQSSFTDVSGNWISRNNRSGMMVQGGIINRSGDTTNVTFPVAFAGTCSAVFITQIAQSGLSTENIIVSSRSLTGCTLIMRSSETAASWVAIGA
ncbi:gp53-like domain-containing protein [Serratia fonticola]|uniref:gp53-like domain-containing protein n=1 Tax=Serratia fonticola TaxID=47917 RepID=UPI000AE92CDC|nr:hypothetical protein [Serratia fonticola]